jgi:hypothetical protein
MVMTTPIPSWSFTKVLDYERCPLYAKLKYVAKVPELPRELPSGVTEQASDRGSRIHKAADDYINRRTNILDPALKDFSPEFNRVRAVKQHDPKKVGTEEEWGFDRDWQPTQWFIAWHRAKVDIKYTLNPYQVLVIDIKSGRRNGNEAKHGQQLQLYGVDTCMRMPMVEEVISEAWYVDTGELTSATYPRKVVLAFKKSWQNRGLKLTSATDFPPNANRFSCKYCSYGPWGTGHCKAGVR